LPPPTTDFSPGDLARAPDPYALLASVRTAGPVLRSHGSWIVLGREAGEAVLRCPAARSGFIAELYRGFLPPGAAREELGSRINFLDPPDHPRVRRLVAKAFTPRRTEALRPFVERLCRSILATLPAHEPIDLVERFAHAIPSLVISELLGVPVADRDRLTRLADRVAALLGLAGLDAARRDDAVAAAEEMHAALRALLDERRRVPADDLLSALLAAEEHAQRLSPSELLSLAATLYSAGHRTTRDSFSNGLAVLLGEPELVRAVQGGALPAAAVVEEFLRFETPTHYVARTLVAPLEVAGVTIPADEPIAVILAAANRDPEAYADADRFDPWRWVREPEPPAVLSFAFGPHFCLGAHLARLENELMLRTLLAVRPALALAGGPLEWRHTGLFRGLAALPVRLGPHRAEAALVGGDGGAAP
jgi:cytochrome P450